MGLLEDIARIQAQVRGGGTPIGSGLPQPFPTTQLSSLNLPQQAGGVKYRQTKTRKCGPSLGLNP